MKNLGSLLRKKEKFNSSTHPGHDTYGFILTDRRPPLDNSSVSNLPGKFYSIPYRKTLGLGNTRICHYSLLYLYYSCFSRCKHKLFSVANPGCTQRWFWVNPYPINQPCDTPSRGFAIWSTVCGKIFNVKVFGYVQNVIGFHRFLAKSSVLSTTAPGWNMEFVLTACYPSAGWDPLTTRPTNQGQPQTLLR
jgi:hypothetical protein